jgi:hypothetical protein
LSIGARRRTLVDHDGPTFLQGSGDRLPGRRVPKPFEHTKPRVKYRFAVGYDE